MRMRRSLPKGGPHPQVCPIGVPISPIGPVEFIRPGQLVKPVFDPDFGEFVLAIHPRNGGEPRLAPCWTELYRETPAQAREFLLRAGAQVALNSLGLVSQ